MLHFPARKIKLPMNSLLHFSVSKTFPPGSRNEAHVLREANRTPKRPPRQGGHPYFVFNSPLFETRRYRPLRLALPLFFFPLQPENAQEKKCGRSAVTHTLRHEKSQGHARPPPNKITKSRKGHAGTNTKKANKTTNATAVK